MITYGKTLLMDSTTIKQVYRGIGTALGPIRTALSRPGAVNGQPKSAESRSSAIHGQPNIAAPTPRAMPAVCRPTPILLHARRNVAA